MAKESSWEPLTRSDYIFYAGCGLCVLSIPTGLFGYYVGQFKEIYRVYNQLPWMGEEMLADFLKPYFITALCLTVLYFAIKAMVYKKPKEETKVLAPMQEARRPRPSYAIENFHDESAFGDGNLADRESIQRAMVGHNTPDAPQFEE